MLRPKLAVCCARLACASLVCAWLLLCASDARAALITISTPAGSSTGGQPVSAKATFTTGTDSVTVLLENLQADPRSVTQNLSGLQFHLAGINPQTGSTQLASSSGTERTVGSDGHFTNGGSASTGWSLSTVGSDLKLNLLGTPAAPAHTIIGPPDGSGVYSNANPSITNGIHSPFFGGSASFTLNVPGVTALTDVTSAIFQFNTSPGFTVNGVVPEPQCAAILFATGLTVLRRRRAL
jgi:hypothetical protein